MNSQKQEQSKQQQQQLQQQQQTTISAQQQYNMNMSAQPGSAAPNSNQQMFLSQPQLQQQQQQQSQQLLSNASKNNNNMNNSKSFTSFLSGVNDLQALQYTQGQNSMIQQQQAQLQQSAQGQYQAKNLQITSFTIKIVEGKLKLANSVDLRPFVQVQFGKRIWRTQINKGSYPKWNEEKRFEIFNKGFDLNNNSGVCSSSATTQSSCSSISPQPSNSNQQNQIFQQQQLLNGVHLPGTPAGYIDWNIEIVVLHKFQNEEIELGRTILNVEEQQMQVPKWFIIQNNSEIFGSVQIQFSFEYSNHQLQINKSSHQIYLNQKNQQKQQQQQPFPNQYSFNYYKGVEDMQPGQQSQQQQVKQQQSSNANSMNISTLNQTPLLSNNKRNASSHSETSSFQDFQFMPQTTSRLASGSQNYNEQIDPLQKLQMSYSTHMGSQPFRQIDMGDLLNQLQQENEMLMKKDKIMSERLVQVQSDTASISKEQSKLEQQQNQIKLQESHLRQKQSGLQEQKDGFEVKLSKLEESKKILDSYIQEYQNLVAEEQDILKSNTKIRSDIKLINEEEPKVQDTLNTLSKENNSEILQLKIFKLKMINHLKEINSIFYNRKLNPNMKGPFKGHHHRAKSYSNHVSFGVDTVTDYSVALKNLQHKIQDLTLVINNKNYEIESLREQIIKIESNYDDQC